MKRDDILHISNVTVQVIPPGWCRFGGVITAGITFAEDLAGRFERESRAVLVSVCDMHRRPDQPPAADSCGQFTLLKSLGPAGRSRVLLKLRLLNFTKYQWSSSEIQSKELIFRVANQEGNIAFPWPAGSNDKHDASRCFPCLEPDNAPRAVVYCRGWSPSSTCRWWWAHPGRNFLLLEASKNPKFPSET